VSILIAVSSPEHGRVACLKAESDAVLDIGLFGGE